MDREILFRGFHEEESGSTTIYVEGKAVKGEWIYGYYWLNTIQRAYITTADGDMYVVIPSTVGQYAGLDDKNGKKIFEGDIIRYRNMNFTIEWQEDNGRFLGVEKNKNRPDGQNYICYVGKELSISETIGNIHDNPDLIKELEK